MSGVGHDIVDTACPLRRQCPAAFGWSSIARLQRETGIGGALRRVRNGALLFGLQGFVDAERWSVVAVEGRWDAVRKIDIDELFDVFFLLEQDAIGVGGDVDVEEVGHGSLVLDVPSC
eukprot:2405230-Pleurochrysis_carterae.AAC.2